MKNKDCSQASGLQDSEGGIAHFGLWSQTVEGALALRGAAGSPDGARIDAMEAGSSKLGPYVIEPPFSLFL